MIAFCFSFISHTQARDDTKSKSIKSAPGKKQLTKVDSKSKWKSPAKKIVKQSPKHKPADDSQKDGESDRERGPSDKKPQAAKKPRSPPKKSPTAALKKSNGSLKRKKAREDDKGSDKNVVTKKRMASLNASAILAANYEIENYAAKHETSSESSSEESDEKSDAEPPTMKKEKKDVKMESEEVFALLCY